MCWSDAFSPSELILNLVYLLQRLIGHPGRGIGPKPLPVQAKSKEGVKVKVKLYPCVIKRHAVNAYGDGRNSFMHF